MILGFILMYLIDTLPRHLHKTSRPQSFQINLNSFSFTTTQRKHHRVLSNYTIRSSNSNSFHLETTNHQPELWLRHEV